MLILWLIGFLGILALRTALLFRPWRPSGSRLAEIIAIPNVEVEEAALGTRRGEGAMDRGRNAEIPVAGAAFAKPNAESPAPRLVSDAADGSRIDFGRGRNVFHADKNRNDAARVPDLLSSHIYAESVEIEHYGSRNCLTLLQLCQCRNEAPVAHASVVAHTTHRIRSWQAFSSGRCDAVISCGVQQLTRKLRGRRGDGSNQQYGLSASYRA